MRTTSEPRWVDDRLELTATLLSGGRWGVLTEWLVLEICPVISYLFVLYRSVNTYRLHLYSTGYRAI